MSKMPAAFREADRVGSNPNPSEATLITSNCP